MLSDHPSDEPKVHRPLPSSTTSNHFPQDLMSLLELLDPIFQESPLIFGRCRLRGDSFRLSVCKLVYCNGREDSLKAADDVALDNLGSDIGYESFRGDLREQGLTSRKMIQVGREWPHAL